jgi:hypothetical protein
VHKNACHGCEPQLSNMAANAGILLHFMLMTHTHITFHCNLSQYFLNDVSTPAPSPGSSSACVFSMFSYCVIWNLFLEISFHVNVNSPLRTGT